MDSFLAAAETLKERGAYKIFVMATHGLLSSDAPRLIEESAIDEVTATALGTAALAPVCPPVPVRLGEECVILWLRVDSQCGLCWCFMDQKPLLPMVILSLTLINEARGGVVHTPPPLPPKLHHGPAGPPSAPLLERQEVLYRKGCDFLQSHS